MKSLTALAAFMVFASLNAAKIDQLLVRQQWPWSTDVKIEYMISEVTEPVDISIKFFNGNEELTPLNYSQTIKGDIYGIKKAGAGTIFFDPVKAFGNAKGALYNFNVELSVSPSTTSRDVLYRVYDLETGDYEDITKAQILNGEKGSFVTDFTTLGEGFNTPLNPSEVVVWTEVTNDIQYLTTKLVMRKISAKDKKFMMGHAKGEVGFYKNDEPLHEVTLINDFFIGVFEVTQFQWDKINGSNVSRWSNELYKDTRPAEYVRYTDIRGTLDEETEWPSKLDYNVGENSFLDKLRKKISGSPKIDLPTEAQWEYACRAMSLTSLNNGKDIENHDNAYNSANLNSIARYKMNGGWVDNGVDADGKPIKVYPAKEIWPTSDTSVGTAKVGSYMPNAWGLYDMHGNVSEWCLDYYSPLAELTEGGWAVDTTEPATNPVGPTRDGAKYSVSADGETSYYRVYRGGSFSSPANAVRSAFRSYSASRDFSLGLRLCLTLNDE